MIEYRARTAHLGLDDDGRLWLLRPAEEDDVPLGRVDGWWDLPEIEGVDESRLHYERDWLAQEWADSPDPADLRDETMATYYEGLRR